ncbi:unnamed protein product [Phaeothamnion confervicola]
MAATKWDSSGSQTDFMYKDEVILLDEDDKIIGHDNKFNSHRFVPGQPRGKLHRAFSVFLFNKQGKVLLQKRAASKITFPNVWTNTCCSHPLFGQAVDEVDYPAAVRDGSVMGVKRAATRKLGHELGMAAKDVPPESFKYLTRLHYYAADAVTHGPASPWGEHEIDYVLVGRVAGEGVAMAPCADEVDDTKWVTQAELKQMMADPELLWSPWFRIIAERFLPAWWNDLDATFTTDACLDLTTIHRFDPPPAYRGGAGVMGVLPERLAAAKKQGGYGKVPVHSSSKLAQLVRLDEVFAALIIKAAPQRSRMPRPDSPAAAADLKFCDNMLGKVSRSFAAVIRQLPAELCRDVLVFYLVLRGLDTVEDDMSAYLPEPSEKVRQLEAFHAEALSNPAFCIRGVGEGDERALLENFGAVTRVFLALPAASREVIADITRKMGAGMAEFVVKDLGQGTATLVEYGKYCHYVAGLVGEGLSRLFAATGVEDAAVAREMQLADSMGQFLQKTNIIRDYLEDYVDGRAFWPADVWRRHAKTGQLGEFALPEHRVAAVACLNELVADALELAPACIAYMEQLRHPDVFRFCAIPQVMAIATLDAVYGNSDVFTGVVKLRKGLACKMILGSGDMRGVCRWFDRCAHDIVYRVRDGDPSARRTKVACARAWTAAREAAARAAAREYAAPLPAAGAAKVALVPAGLAFAAIYFANRGADGGYLDPSWVPIADRVGLVLMAMSVVYVVGMATAAAKQYVAPRRAATAAPDGNGNFRNKKD